MARRGEGVVLALGAQLIMISDMRQRKYKYNVGDICWILDGPLAYTLTRIRYPSFYIRGGCQTYITTASDAVNEDYPCLFLECDLELLFKYKNGEQETKNFLNKAQALVDRRLDDWARSNKNR